MKNAGCGNGAAPLVVYFCRGILKIEQMFVFCCAGAKVNHWKLLIVIHLWRNCGDKDSRKKFLTS